MMKFLPIVSLLIIALWSCGKTKKKQSPYFEGIVEFNIHIQSSSAALDSILYKKMGQYATTNIKDSFVSRIYYTADNIIVMREVLRTDSLKLYTLQEDSDTILVSDMKNDYYNVNVSTKEMGTKKIMGRNCLKVLVTNLYRPSMFADPEVANITYYFDTSIQLAPYIHHNVKYGSYDKVFSKYHFLTLAYEFKVGSARFYVEAKRIIRNHINPIVFEIPKNKILVDPYLR